MMVYVVVLGLMLLVILPVYYTRMTRAYSDEVHRLEQHMDHLNVAKEELEVEVAGLAAQEDELLKHKSSFEVVEEDPTLPSLGGGASEGYKTPEEYLLSAGTITQQDLDKARKFKEGSKSPYDLGEILVMMDTISGADLQLAKSKVQG